MSRKKFLRFLSRRPPKFESILPALSSFSWRAQCPTSSSCLKRYGKSVRKQNECGALVLQSSIIVFDSFACCDSGAVRVAGAVRRRHRSWVHATKFEPSLELTKLFRLGVAFTTWRTNLGLTLFTGLHHFSPRLWIPRKPWSS